MVKTCIRKKAPPDTTEFLNQKGITRIQSINPSFLYYGRAIDPTILTALNEIATQQAKPTINTKAKAQTLMDYLATYPNCNLTFLHRRYEITSRNRCCLPDNSTANSFVHLAIREKQSKSWDMQYNWLRDRQAQQQFEIKWQEGATTQADYFTKHHSPSHHKVKRYDYILRGY